MGARVVGALAMLGGAAWGILGAVTIFYPLTPWTGTPSEKALMPMVIGALGVAGAIAGLALLYQDQIRARAGYAAAIGSTAMVLVVLGGNWLTVGVVPIASTILVWELAHIGAISRALAVAHGLSAVLFLGLAANYIDDGTLSSPLLVAMGVPYALTWIVIGVSVMPGCIARTSPHRRADRCQQTQAPLELRDHGLGELDCLV